MSEIDGLRIPGIGEMFREYVERFKSLVMGIASLNFRSPRL